ncbi:MAG: hypothetical protein KKF68_00080 [Nanoarchaeota archaeon]|nr:hypothetical protein [Nanoarchaeota archaeon]
MKSKNRKIAIAEILILVLGIFSFSYLLYQTMPLISAQDILGCCTETNTGAKCQDLVLGSDECKEALLPSQCKDTSNCKLGCCIDEEEGLCSEKSPKDLCTSDGGTWKDNEVCNIIECQKGCCVLGTQTNYVTDARCGKLAGFYGIEKDFRQQIKTELECVLLAESQEHGACILGEDVCKFTTQGDCVNKEGEFHKDVLCSNPYLETSCEQQVSVGCVEGLDEIYWFDSCGNRENIYNADKNVSWNNGELLPKDQSCNPTSANIESETCGNCNYFLGSKCGSSEEIKIKDGNFICQDLNCYNTYDGSDRVNGESWCIYDASIGTGTDVVGSRHWKHMCIDGKEVVEPCADYRQEICAEEIVEISTDKKVSMSNCIINEWRSCFSYNELSADKMVKKCSENQHCYLKSLWHPGGKVAQGPIQTCLPEYPPGLIFWGDQSSASQICSPASQNLDVTAVKECGFLGISEEWVYVANDVARTETWSQIMNKWCTNLGDCGAYVNIEGEVTTGGYSTSGVARALSASYLSQLASFNIPNPDAKGKISGIVPIEEEEDTSWTTLIGYGVLGQWLYEGIAGLDVFAGAVMNPMGTWSEAGFLNFMTQPYFAAPAAIVASYFAGQMIGQLMGLDEASAQQVGIAGAIGAIGSVAYTSFFGGGFNAVTFGTTFMWGIIVAVVVAIWMQLKGCGEQAKWKAGFTCRAWDPPSGGKDCEKCNEGEKDSDGNLFHECSEYRCKSLGAACEFINAGTTDPKCIWSRPNDAASPVISPWQESLSKGYNFETSASCPSTCSNKVIRNNESGCLEAYKSITFGIQTDEYAKCKFDTSNKQYEDMVNSFTGLYTENHSTVIMSPGIITLEAELERLRKQFKNETGEPLGQEYIDNIINKSIDGTLRLYIKCKDVNGNTNSAPLLVEMCLDPEPDTTPPHVVSINPNNNRKIAYGLTEQDILMYVNEPAECKYSSTDKIYDEMENSFDCQTELSEGTIKGWLCATKLTNLQNENSYYIRCKDKPYSVEQERNANLESYNYVISKSLSELSINSISPDGDVGGGFEPISVSLEVKTSGGANNGVSICYYKWGNNWISFMETDSKSHKQQLSLGKGSYSVEIKCVDEAENEAYGETSFHLNLDTSPPSVARAYKEGNKLIVITDEKAECFYHPNKCYFDIENATLMTTVFSREHSAEWITGQVYHIKCIDIWGNKADGCSMKIFPNSLV